VYEMCVFEGGEGGVREMGCITGGVCMAMVLQWAVIRMRYCCVTPGSLV
jgi:hypothetical protein